MSTSDNRERFLLPPAIAALRDRSARARERVIARYMRARVRPARPPYLEGADIVRTHLERSAMELSPGPAPRSAVVAWRAYSRDAAAPHRFSGLSGALSEVCVGVMGEVLRARGELQVAAGFFSTMVACVDDYLDREGSYQALGERLLVISHCYRDLMDMALDGQVEAGRLSEGELFEIRVRLADVMETLAGSERAAGADDYLYEKSCGDKVIGVLFPASGASTDEKERCAEIGRLVGEAGQLIDDMVDYGSDIETGGRNYISGSGAGLNGAIKGAAGRVSEARGIAGGLPENKGIFWVLDALDEAVCIIEERRGAQAAGHPLARSAFLGALVPDGRFSDTFLVWF